MGRNSKRGGNGTLSREEAELWSLVARSVTPQHSDRLTEKELKDADGTNALPQMPERAVPKRKQRQLPALLVDRPVLQDGSTHYHQNLTPSVRENVPGLDRRSSEKLRKGRMTIDGRVDLHGLTQKEAHARLRSFLGSAHRQGKRCVLVITGKGSSPEKSDDAPFMGGGRRGVLREEVPKWLALPDLRRLVLDTRTAQDKHGGSGALYVLLRRQRLPQ
jgi:DNA-nicking Smr family endonuclease